MDVPHKMVDGQIIPLTDEEIAARDAEANPDFVLLRINERRDGMIADGFPYSGAVFDADADSRSMIDGIVAGANAGKGLPGGKPSIAWWDKHNVSHTFTVSEFIDFSAAIRDWVSEVYSVARAHKDTVLAKGTQTEIDAYDYSVDWPG